MVRLKYNEDKIYNKQKIKKNVKKINKKNKNKNNAIPVRDEFHFSVCSVPLNCTIKNVEKFHSTCSSYSHKIEYLGRDPR